MIVRKEEYKVDEAAFLLDLPARAILSLCDAGVLKCSRLVANGALKQRKKRYIAHGEIIRFNQTRQVDHRVNLAARLVDPDGPEQLPLPFDGTEADDDSAVWVSPVQWRTIVAGVAAFGNTMPAMLAIGELLGPGGNHVIEKGLKVRKPQEIAS